MRSSRTAADFSAVTTAVLLWSFSVSSCSFLSPLSPLCMYMCIYIYIYMHICMYIYIYMCVYIYIYSYFVTFESFFGVMTIQYKLTTVPKGIGVSAWPRLTPSSRCRKKLRTRPTLRSSCPKTSPTWRAVKEFESRV